MRLARPACYRGAQHEEAVRTAVLPVKAQHLVEGELRADISVEHKEGLRVPREDLVPEVVDAATSAEGRVLLQIPAQGGLGALPLSSSMPSHTDRPLQLATARGLRLDGVSGSGGFEG